ncbi:MAG TPA: HepT-like ribonuclease domain-containing protein [Xanthobacteraceae bacterium]
MPSNSPILRLEDILENIGLIEEYTCIYSAPDFVRDRKCQDAGERCLLRISEAAKKLEGVIEAMIPGQPWAAIRAVGNVLRHDYDRVDANVIWRIVSEDLNPLKMAVESSVNELRRQIPIPPEVYPELEETTYGRY